jgi:uncharacterized repeat protein (TIGR02543 family)
MKMKKTYFAFIAAIGLSIIACSSPTNGNGIDKKYSIIFNSNGGTEITSLTDIPKGEKITAPTDPTRDPENWYEFAGWYKEASLATSWKFDIDSVNANTTLYAKWNPLIEVADDVTGPGGGTIFYASSEGFIMEDTGIRAYYLEAAPEDSGTASWGAYNTIIPNATVLDSIGGAAATKIGNGRKDTLAIVKYLKDNTTETGTAAQLCNEADFGGQDDWFLPSLGELTILCDIIGYDLEVNDLWSSTQRDSQNAWYMAPTQKNRYSKSKDATNVNVLAIRAF